MIAVYFVDVILLAYYLKKEQGVEFLNGLAYSWTEVFKISKEIYIDWGWVIIAAVIFTVLFIKGEKKEQMSKEN